MLDVVFKYICFNVLDCCLDKIRDVKTSLNKFGTATNDYLHYEMIISLLSDFIWGYETSENM